MKTAKEYIRDYTKRCSNAIVGWNQGESETLYQPWITPDNALAAVEISKENIIEESVNWIKENANNYVESVNTIFGKIKVVNANKMSEDFKQYIKGKQS